MPVRYGEPFLLFMNGQLRVQRQMIRNRFQHIIAGIILILLTPVAMLMFDHPIAQWVANYQPLSFFQEELWHCVMRFELFGHFVGVILAVAAVFFLDPPKRPWLLRLVGAIVASDIVAAFFKSLVVRFRPRFFFHEDFTGHTQTVWQSFDGMEMLKSVFGDTASFPSGHSAVAWSLALVLGWLYPQGRWFFIFLAIMVMIQRVLSSAHFPSDTFAGAAIGILVTSLLLPDKK